MTPHPKPPFSEDRLPEGVEPPTGTDPRTLGTYQVVGRIGAGGMGAVYAGVAEDGSSAAVKVVHPQFAADPDFRARFAREVDMVARVRATCTPAFLGADTRAATPWLATEYVPGRTLRQYVRENGPLSGGMLVALAVGLAEALNAIHSVGVVHRDLKPGNVILAPDGPKVLDFGIARAADGTALTATGGLFGTPGWVAPEQYMGQDATGYSDMFAWGGLVLFAATGEAPFGTGQADVLSYRVRNEEPDLSALVEPLADPVRRAMSKDPGQRPTAAEVLSELTGSWNATRVEPVAAADPTEVVPGLLATEWRGISAPETSRVRRKRSWAWPGVGAAVLALVLVAGGIFVWPGSGVPGLGLPGPGSEAADGDDRADAADAGAAEERGSGVGDADSAPAVEMTPEDMAAVLTEAIEQANEVGSFEAYQRSTTADAHGEYLVHRYTEDPRPVLYKGSHGGPTHSEFLAFGGDLLTGEGVERLGRTTMTPPPGVEPDPAPYGRDPEPANTLDYAAEFGPGQWSFLWYVSLLLEAESDTQVDYMGVVEPVQPDSAWDWNDFDGRPEHGPAHHYTGTYTMESHFDEQPTAREYVFDLWIGEDGRFQRYEHYREQTSGEGGEFEGAEGWEVIAVGFDQPVSIEVPDESRILDAPAAPY